MKNENHTSKQPERNLTLKHRGLPLCFQSQQTNTIGAQEKMTKPIMGIQNGIREEELEAQHLLTSLIY